jgi:hypothetical protein
VSRSRGISGWLGILTGGAMFAAALALPLDDPALVVALALAVRSSCIIRCRQLASGASSRSLVLNGQLAS